MSVGSCFGGRAYTFPFLWVTHYVSMVIEGEGGDGAKFQSQPSDEPLAEASEKVLSIVPCL